MTELFITATEAVADEGGGNALPFVILVIALAAFGVAYMVVGPGRRKKGPTRRGDIPLAMRPYHSDDELEKTALERAMSWGVALSVFMAIFLPLYWVIEPARIDDKVDLNYSSDVNMGRGLYSGACVSCHGAAGGGGSAPNPDPDIKSPWPAPALNNIVARYAENDNVGDIREFITQTVKQGRPGTPMPTWGSFYGGPMNDQEISSIVEYVLAIQTGEIAEAQSFVGASTEDIFAANCARCHGEGGVGGLAPELTQVFARYGDDGTPNGATQSQAAIRSTILNGRFIPTGASMPAWKDVLTQGAIDKVIAYLQSIQK